MNLRSAITMPCILLCSILSVQAQSDARKALNNEPEVRQINGLAANLKATGQLPDNDIHKPSLAGMAIHGIINVRTEQALLDQLEVRLNAETRACNFCSTKQGELSELIRERIAIQGMFDDAASGGSPFSVGGSDANLMKQLFGAAPATSRWQDKTIAIEEAEKALVAHCSLAKDKNATECAGKDRAERVAGEHEIAWAKCFDQHNWVDNPRERTSYEACMTANDPLTRFCAEDHGVADSSSCHHYSVGYNDVMFLHHYTDRWTKAVLTAQSSVIAVLLNGQPEHVTLLEPLVVPVSGYPDRPGQNFQAHLRARVDTPLVGTSEAVPGQVVLVPAGTEIMVDALVGTPNRDKSGGNINLQAMTVITGNGVLKQVYSRNIYRNLPRWPEAGTVLAPVGTQLNMLTTCGCNYAALVKDFRQPTAEDKAAMVPPASNGITSVFSDTGTSGSAANYSTPPVQRSSANSEQTYNVEAIRGIYSGTYSCRQSEIGLKMRIDPSGGNAVTAIFKAQITGLPAYDLAGTYDPNTFELSLHPVRWRGQPLRGYVMVGMRGKLDPEAGTLKGKITAFGCTDFELKIAKKN